MIVIRAAPTSRNIGRRRAMVERGVGRYVMFGMSKVLALSQHFINNH